MGAIVLGVKIDELSMNELKDLQRRVTKAIEEFHDRKKRQAISMLEEQAQALGFSLAELVSSVEKRRRMPARVKYSNPDNSTETWTGRGRKPEWVVTFLGNGGTLEELQIKSN